ncbi:hypothetical protein EMIHUDRAFT_448691, partial [Emiliania huxleyi CCMP1516]|uniref:Uncharacterized protein n=2 Tax=Emiliania huxleyi TaxID=2903 RepID=A0A0D3KZD9_EMIH1
PLERFACRSTPLSTPTGSWSTTRAARRAQARTSLSRRATLKPQSPTTAVPLAARPLLPLHPPPRLADSLARRCWLPSVCLSHSSSARPPHLQSPPRRSRPAAPTPPPTPLASPRSRETCSSARAACRWQSRSCRRGRWSCTTQTCALPGSRRRPSAAGGAPAS